MKKKSKPQIIYLLSLLSSSEINRFKRYLDSPLYLNANNKFSEWVTALEPFCIKEIEEVDPNWQKVVWKKVKPNEPLRESYQKKNLSILQGHLIMFLGIQAFVRDQKAKHNFQLRALNQLNDNRLFLKYHRLALEGLTESQNLDVVTYRKRVEADQEMTDYFLRNPALENNQTFIESRKLIDNSYLVERLKLATRIESHASVYQLHETDPMLHVNLEYLKQGERWRDYPLLVRFYFLAFQILTTDFEKHLYDEFEGLLLDEAYKLAKPEALFLFSTAFNHCAKRINGGKNQFLDRLSALYKKALSLDILLSFGTIAPRTLKNIVEVLCRSGELKKATEISNKFKDKVAGDLKNQFTFEYNQGVIDFYKGQYETASQKFSDYYYNLAQTVKGKFYHLDARKYYIQCLFELGSSDKSGEREYFKEIELQAKSLRYKVRRDKETSESSKENLLNFTRHISALCLAVQQTPTKRVVALKKLENELLPGVVPQIQYVYWMNEKIKEWKKRK